MAFPSAERSERLAQNLEQSGKISSPAVAEAFRQVRRHEFVPRALGARAYDDVSIDLTMCSCASQPSVVATMLEQLAVGPGHRVLEIGTGSGFNAALLSHLVGPSGHVSTIELDPALAAVASKNLERLGYDNVTVVVGDGCEGHRETAPFDRIIVTCAAFDLAPMWMEQMSESGRIVAPLVLQSVIQAGVAMVRRGNELVGTSTTGCYFIPQLGAANLISRTAVPLDSDRGIYAMTSSPGHVDAEQLLSLLGSDPVDHELEFDITLGDIWLGLGAWLSPMPSLCAIRFMDNSVADGFPVPGLSWFRTAVTGLGLNTSGGIGLLGIRDLMKPTGAPAEPHKVFVRCFGDSEGIVDLLRSAIAAWDAAKRPTLDQLTISAVRRGESTMNDCPDALRRGVISKDWNDLHLVWHPDTKRGQSSGGTIEP